MNFQSKVFETTADLRARAAALANVAVVTARTRANQAAERVGTLKGSLAALQLAGRDFNKVARRHVSKFVKQNTAIAREAGKDVSALARSTYSQLATRETVVTRKPRKAAARKRAAKAA